MRAVLEAIEMIEITDSIAYHVPISYAPIGYGLRVKEVNFKPSTLNSRQLFKKANNGAPGKAKQTNKHNQIEPPIHRNQQKFLRTG